MLLTLHIVRWTETVKAIMAQKVEREFELKAAESVVVDGVRLVELGTLLATVDHTKSNRSFPTCVCFPVLETIELCTVYFLIRSFGVCTAWRVMIFPEGIVDVRIIVGEVENAKMEDQQAINFRRGKTRYVKLMPDLREAIRLGRRDFDSIHVWYLTARTGGGTNRIRCFIIDCNHSTRRRSLGCVGHSLLSLLLSLVLVS
jgi:hypothetical protein